MDPTMAVQPGGAGSAMMNSPQMGHGDGMGSMMGDCPCMQMHQMMTSSPMGWVMAITMAILVVAAIAALVSLSVFLIRRSRLGVAA